MTCSIIVATYGSDAWRIQAEECGGCSAHEQPAHEVIIHHGSGTLAQARNDAAAQATGDWLCFLDADDELAPGYLDAMAAAAARGSGPRLLGPAAEWVRRMGFPKYRGQLGPTCDLVNGNWLVIGTVLPRKLFEQVGGFREWPVYEDWDLWQRCIIAGAEVVEVPDALYVAYTHPRSRNRARSMRWKNEVHHEIRRSNYPELYEEA